MSSLRGYSKLQPLSDKLHKTKGIVLRTVKYGETSLVVTVFTELFGLQSYLVNGIRTSSKKGTGKANMFQPSAILDMVVYHHELKHLNRIREFRWDHLYLHIFSDVPKNAVALFMVELLTKCLKQPEPNPELFYFVEDALVHLDESNPAITGNFPLFFALHLAVFFGVLPSPPSEILNESDKLYFDLVEGTFTTELPAHQHYTEGKLASVTAELLMMRQPEELEQLKLNQQVRRSLLQLYETYYGLHMQDFGTMKTLPVLRELLG